jgi:hypothetical protein
MCVEMSWSCMEEAISHVLSNFCLNILFFKFFKWDLEFFRNFEKKNYKGRKVLELHETCRSA